MDIERIMHYIDEIPNGQLPEFLVDTKIPEPLLKVTLGLLLSWLRNQEPGHEADWDVDAESDFGRTLRAILSHSDLREIFEWDSEVIRFRPSISLAERSRLIDYVKTNYTSVVHVHRRKASF